SLPAEMKRAMAKQAEAERERRAKIIWSEGELQAASKLAEAAKLISSEPAALQLRLYQTMVEVSSSPNMTIVLPVPIELLSGNAPGSVGKLAASTALALGSGRAGGVPPAVAAAAQAALGDGTTESTEEQRERITISPVR